MDDRKRWEAVSQYEKKQLDEISKGKELSLGDHYSFQVQRDLKHIGFTISRYKFVCKLLAYKKEIRVLELGCNEGIGAEMIRQNTDVAEYTGIDLDERAIEWARDHFDERFTFVNGNFLEDEVLPAGKYLSDLVFSLDVIEHIETKMEDCFFEKITANLKPDGVAVIGTPNITMTPYASEQSRLGHINMYDQKRLYELASKYFNNVFVFGMNDEIVHTGFEPMACYIFVVCSFKK